VLGYQRAVSSRTRVPELEETEVASLWTCEPTATVLPLIFRATSAYA